MLCFQAEAIAEMVGLATFASEFSIEKIAAVKLQAWLGGEDFDHATGRWFMDGGGESEFPALVIEHPVVIVAATKFDLLVIGIHSLANAMGCGEIERGLFHWTKFSRGNEADVDGGKA